MKLPQLTLKIEKLNSSGEGMARYEGKVCFVSWSVPGDTVVAQIEKENRDYNKCRILEIVEKSPDRVLPPCPYFFNCGGCQLQQMTYEAQLKWKREIIIDALKRISGLLTLQIPDVISSPKIWNYRNRIRLHVDRKKRIGFYRHQSHELIEINECLIADEKLNERLQALRAGAIHESPLQDSIELRVDEKRSFTQVNPEQNENLLRIMLEMAQLGGGERVIDLYCGHGNLTFLLAEKSKSVIGIDREITAINEAIALTSARKIQNIRWIQGSALTTLMGLKKEGMVIDLLVTDPPRRGLAEATEGVLALKPGRIVYVSCNPATFARDTMSLLHGGYQLTRLQPLDMFPHTSHVELVAQFIPFDR